MTTLFSDTFLDGEAGGCEQPAEPLAPCEGSVLVADLRGIGGASAEDAGSAAGAYLGMMSDAILANAGTVASYIGGGILAVFAEADHGDAAMAAAIAMLNSLEHFNDWTRADGISLGYRIGIGINSGPVLPAHAAPEEPQLLGDTTTTAAKLERLTRDSRHQALVSGATRAQLRRPGALLRYVDEIEAGPSNADIEVWALMRSPRNPNPQDPRPRPRRPRRRTRHATGHPTLSVVSAA
jgi:adenylate cyclase